MHSGLAVCEAGGCHSIELESLESCISVLQYLPIPTLLGREVKYHPGSTEDDWQAVANKKQRHNTSIDSKIQYSYSLQVPKVAGTGP